MDIEEKENNSFEKKWNDTLENFTKEEISKDENKEEDLNELFHSRSFKNFFKVEYLEENQQFIKFLFFFYC